MEFEEFNRARPSPLKVTFRIMHHKLYYIIVNIEISMECRKPVLSIFLSLTLIMVILVIDDMLVLKKVPYLRT